MCRDAVHIPSHPLVLASHPSPARALPSMGYNRRVLYGKSCTDRETSSPYPHGFLYKAVPSKACVLGCDPGSRSQCSSVSFWRKPKARGEVVCDLGSAPASSTLDVATAVNHSWKWVGSFWSCSCLFEAFPAARVGMGLFYGRLLGINVCPNPAAISECLWRCNL